MLFRSSSAGTGHTALLGKRVESITPSLPLPGGWARVVAVHMSGSVSLECRCCGNNIGMYHANNVRPLPDEPVMPMLPNDYHPSARCSCRECLEKFK